jgi:hypothetical protein
MATLCRYVCYWYKLFILLNILRYNEQVRFGIGGYRILAEAEKKV